MVMPSRDIYATRNQGIWTLKQPQFPLSLDMIPPNEGQVGDLIIALEIYFTIQNDSNYFSDIP